MKIKDIAGIKFNWLGILCCTIDIHFKESDCIVEIYNDDIAVFPKCYKTENNEVYIIDKTGNKSGKVLHNNDDQYPINNIDIHHSKTRRAFSKKIFNKYKNIPKENIVRFITYSHSLPITIFNFYNIFGRDKNKR